MKLELRDYQQKAFEDAREAIRKGARSVLINAPTGGGKCLGKGTPILMADGTIKPVEDVVVGDRLASPTGGFRTVLSLGRGKELMYRVTPKKGDPYICNASHLLSLRKTPGSDGLVLADGTKIGKEDDFAVVPAFILAQSNRSAKHALKGWRSAVLTFEGQSDCLPIDPYILGVWLGDGTSYRPEITKPEGPMVDAWIAWGKTLGLNCVREDSNGTRCPTWKLTNGKKGGRENPATGLLRKVGVWENKHIPSEYLTSSFFDRLALIAGLLDSDGHMSKAGFDWISADRSMAQSMAFLCRSVGLACYVVEVRKGIASIGFSGTYWRCSISGDCERIPCKKTKAPARMQKKRHLVHGIKLDPIGVDDYYGFEIDGDRLFMLGDFTVTHNTVLATALMEMTKLKGNRANFVVDRLSLIQQTSDTFDRYGLDHGVVQSQHPRWMPHESIQVCSVQTISRRKWPTSHVDVIDEAHVLHQTVKDRITSKTTLVIGLTATPFTRGLAKYFDAVVNVTTTRKLINDGWLSPYRIFSCAEPDMTGVKVKSTGEWDDAEASSKALEVVGDVVQEYLQHGENRKFICSAVDTNHVEELQRQFLRAGINVATYTYKDKEEDRADVTLEFRKPDSVIRGLITVTAASRGFDIPDVSCIIMARPLRKSLAEHIQLFGRGLRIAPGKKDCIVLDHSGNAARFWNDTEDFFDNGVQELDDGKPKPKKAKEQDAEEKSRKCPKCGHLHKIQPFCPACGHEYPRKVIQHSAGSLKELIAAGDTRRLTNDLWPQICGYVRQRREGDAARRQALAIYKSMTGSWPTRDFYLTPIVTPSLEVMNRIRHSQIAYAKVKR